MVKRPAYIDTVQRAIEESRPADMSSNALEAAWTWLHRNDPEAEDNDGDLLLMSIEDELDFRNESDDWRDGL